ncbi:MAG: hypothetical protein AAF213_13660 [Pseudomonadota bacterium]
MTADLTGIEDNSLSPSQHLFVWLLRTWFRGMVMGQDTTDFMAHVCFDTGIGDAVDDLDEFFAMIASGARRQYSVGCDQCTHVHRFEVQLVNALAALQRNEWDHATYLIEFYVKPDEAYMAGPPAYRLGAAMALAGWDIGPRLARRV